MSKILREEVKKDCLKPNDIYGLIDNLFFTFYNITNEEFILINQQTTDEELYDFAYPLGAIDVPLTISDIRKGIIIRNKYIKYFKNKL